MKIEIKPKCGDKYRLELKQGVQSFNLEYEGTREECLWYASMLKIAIAEHDNAGKPLQVIEVEDERKYGSD